MTTASDIYTTVALGTVGHDSMTIGVFSGDKSIDIMGHYIDLTGVADSDVMEGGTTSDIFVAGEGSASFKGRAGSDLYFIGDDADVSIHDTGSTSLSNFVDLLKSTYDLVFSMDILAAPDFAESLSRVLSHTNRDAVVFTNCSFDDMEVSFDSDGNNYIIEAGTSVVTVPKRNQDFYIVDASGQTVADGMMLDDLYALKQGVNSTSIAPMSVDGEDYSEYVSFYIGGDDAAVRLTDVESGEELRTIAVGDTSGIVDVCLDHGTFVIDGTGKTIDGLYDSSKIKAEIIGDCNEVIANDVVG